MYNTYVATSINFNLYADLVQHGSHFRVIGMYICIYVIYDMVLFRRKLMFASKSEVISYKKISFEFRAKQNHFA